MCVGMSAHLGEEHDGGEGGEAQVLLGEILAVLSVGLVLGDHGVGASQGLGQGGVVGLKGLRMKCECVCDCACV